MMYKAALLREQTKQGDAICTGLQLLYTIADLVQNMCIVY